MAHKKCLINDGWMNRCAKVSWSSWRRVLWTLTCNLGSVFFKHTSPVSLVIWKQINPQPLLFRNSKILADIERSHWQQGQVTSFQGGDRKTRKSWYRNSQSTTAWDHSGQEPFCTQQCPTIYPDETFWMPGPSFLLFLLILDGQKSSEFWFNPSTLLI